MLHHNATDGIAPMAMHRLQCTDVGATNVDATGVNVPAVDAISVDATGGDATNIDTPFLNSNINNANITKASEKLPIFTELCCSSKWATNQTYYISVERIAKIHILFFPFSLPLSFCFSQY